MSWLSSFYSNLTGSTLTDTFGGAVESIPVVGPIAADIGVGAVSNIGSVAGDWFDESVLGSGDDGFSGGATVPAVYNGSGGGEVYSDSGGMVQTAGAMGAVAAGAVSLGALLARTFGRAAAVWIAPNGVRVSLAKLWPLVRQYGPVSVAGALGVSAATLADMLMRAPTSARKRRRGISSRDISTTKRVIRFSNQLARSIGRSGGHRHRSSGWRQGGGRHSHR